KFKSPSDLVVDSSGNLFVADTSDHAIRKIATGGSNAVTTIAGTILSSGSPTEPGNASASLLNSPDGIGIDSSNNLYIADTGNNEIRKITAGDAVIDASDTISKVEGTAAQNTSCTGTASTGVTLSSPGDVVAVNSDLYVADTG